jgi:hypothetical protein
LVAGGRVAIWLELACYATIDLRALAYAVFKRAINVKVKGALT